MPSSSSGIIYLLLLCSFFLHCVSSQQLCVRPSRAWLIFSKAPTILLTQRHHSLKSSQADLQSFAFQQKHVLSRYGQTEQQDLVGLSTGPSAFLSALSLSSNRPTLRACCIYSIPCYIAWDIHVA